MTIAASTSSSVLSSDDRKAAAAPWKRRLDAGRQAELALRLLDGLDGAAERGALGEVERHGHRGELPGVVDHERRVAVLDGGDVGQRNLPAIRRGHEHLAERLRADLEARRDLEDDAVLIGLRVDRRDQPLAERVVERVVDGRHADAEPAGGVAVDVEEGLQARGPAGRWPRRPGTADCWSRSTSLGTHRLRRVASGSSSVNWNCVRLTRSSIVRSCTGCMYSVMPGTPATRSRSAAMISVADRSRSPCGVSVTSMRPLLSVALAAVDADERRQPLDVRLLEDGPRRRTLPIGHRGERHRLRCLGDHLDGARVLHREEALGDDDVQPDGQREGRDRHEQRDRLVAQRHVQHAPVQGNHAVEELPRHGEEAAVLSRTPRPSAGARTSSA